MDAQAPRPPDTALRTAVAPIDAVASQMDWNAPPSAIGGQPSSPSAASGGGGSSRRWVGHTPSDELLAGQFTPNWQPQQRQQQPNQRAARHQRHGPRNQGWGESMRNIEVACCLFVLGVQTVLWGRTAASLTLRGHVNQAAQVSLQLCCLALALCLPRGAWRRYR